MRRVELIQRVRNITRDLSNSIFRETDIVDYINEGIDRIIQVLPQLKDMPYLLINTDEPTMLPRQYQHLLSVYGSARCFGQDERHYQETNFMNEFETKLEELKMDVEAGKIVLLGADGNPLTSSYIKDSVQNDYYVHPNYSDVDFDDGVEGVE
jgi:hypothetical protein